MGRSPVFLLLSWLHSLLDVVAQGRRPLLRQVWSEACMLAQQWTCRGFADWTKTVMDRIPIEPVGRLSASVGLVYTVL